MTIIVPQESRVPFDPSRGYKNYQYYLTHDRSSRMGPLHHVGLGVEVVGQTVRTWDSLPLTGGGAGEGEKGTGGMLYDETRLTYKQSHGMVTSA